MKIKNNIRTCIISKTKNNKYDMIRLIVKNNVLIIDKEYKLEGRGYYLSKDKSIIDKVLNNRQLLSNKVKVEVTKDFYDKLKNF